jgi:pSer/pThr/pTyr-binding forkhead associated (FHA) protein
MILGREDLVIGSGSSCGLQIADGSVARSHAVISRRRGRWLVADARSASGTFVNDKRVRWRRRLKHRDGFGSDRGMYIASLTRTPRCDDITGDSSVAGC